VSAETLRDPLCRVAIDGHARRCAPAGLVVAFPGRSGTRRGRIRGIGRRLHAVVAELPAANGPLSGLPYVTKDMIATGGAPPHWGCAEPMENSSVAAGIVDRLSAAGARLIATAEMTELAYEPSGINAVRGNVLNPWNTAFAPGGSSSGSAALVASGCCFVALGSDTGGSVRIPAHCCGVTALKPTWGLIAVDGTMPLSPSLDTIGILARAASDVAAVWGALIDESIQPQPPLNTITVLEDALTECHPEIARNCRRAIDAMADAGMPIVGRAGFPEQADHNTMIVMPAEAARSHAARLDDNRIDPVLRKRLGKGLSITDDQLSEALVARERLRFEFIDRYLSDADIAVLPVAPIRTPRLGEVDPVLPGFTAKTLYALSRFTRFVNYFGLPALAIPVGFDDRGMPVGLQLVGRPNSEAVLLGVATKFQATTDWHGRVPTAVASAIAAEKGLAA
jgi:aspartyl-tRNA(Asn)/glutamyl-tRNA(Gln) amidotransferase subunit A